MSGEVLFDAAAALWPGSEVVPEGTTADGRLVQARYAVVRRRRDPKVLVPLEPAAAAAALRKMSAASTLAESTARILAGAAVRRAPALLRERVEVRGGEPGLAEHLASMLGTPVTFSISVGTARVNRKPVLQVFDPDGRVLAFAKVGCCPNTADDVVAEARALATVAGHRFDHVVPPRLLALGNWRGHPVLVTEALQPAEWPRPRGRVSPPLAAMEELATEFPPNPSSRHAAATFALADSAWWQRQWQLAGELADPIDRGRLGRAMELVAALAGDRQLRFGAWHGDWTPWNMARSREGVLLWDWERFEIGVPVGLDPLHYAVNALNPGGPPTPDALLRALAFGSGEKLRSGNRAHVRGALYLVAMLTRYLTLAQTRGGHHIAPRAAHTLLALERLTTA